MRQLWMTELTGRRTLHHEPTCSKSSWEGLPPFCGWQLNIPCEAERPARPQLFCRGFFIPQVQKLAASLSRSYAEHARYIVCLLLNKQLSVRTEGAKQEAAFLGLVRFSACAVHDSTKHVPET